MKEHPEPEPLETKDGETLETNTAAPGEIKDGDLGRQPGNGGTFVPPLWLGKIVKMARSSRR